MILLAGATGALGGDIASRLLKAGHPVRALVRPGSDHSALVIAGAEIATGDLKNVASLRDACLGITTVITTANSAQRGGADTVESVEIAGNTNLIDAAREVGAGQFIFVSSLGARTDSPVPLLRGKALAAQHLVSSGVPYTILEPNLFMEVWIGMLVAAPLAAGRPVTLVGAGERRHSLVSSHDVAAFAVSALGRTEALNRTIPIGGPEPLSWRDIVARAEQVAGRPIEVRSIEPGQAIPGLPDSVSKLAAGMEMYDSPIDMTETAYTFGVSLTPVESVLAGLLQGQAA
jgi:NADH dehydrogenase